MSELSDPAITPIAPSKVPALRDMGYGDIAYALRAGLDDFRRKPMMGLFFSHVYVVGGWLLYVFLFVTDQIWWSIPITLGFPLLGPFLAVGLYEVSRRLEAGQSQWRRNDIFGVIWLSACGNCPRWRG